MSRKINDFGRILTHLFSDKKIWAVSLVTILFGVAFAAIFTRAMMAQLDHDENQFVASGQLLSTLGEIPYRDYPYFHMPFMVGVYAVIFHFTNHLLLAARTFSVLCSWLCLLLLFSFSWKLSGRQAFKQRLLFASGIAALLFVNPLFNQANFRAWNHPLPVLLTLIAFFFHWRAAYGFKFLFGVSGLVMALAAGTRLSFFPLEAAFLLMAWLVPGTTSRSRLGFVALHAGGFISGLLLVLTPMLQAYPSILFDNVSYNEALNTAYRGESANFFHSVLAKITFCFNMMIRPPNLAFLLMFTFIGIRAPFRHDFYTYPRRLILLVTFFSLFGVFAPTPYTGHYYFPLGAFGATAIALGLIEYRNDERFWNRGMFALWLCILIGLGPAILQYRELASVFSPQRWVTCQLHQLGEEIRAFVGPGKILTLAPIIPMEGGAPIYASFATGPFSWRTARFLSSEQRSRYKFVSEIELAKMLDADPPGGILVGSDMDEQPFVDYAVSHHYISVLLANKRILYLPH
jgi:hypothetical protein